MSKAQQQIESMVARSQSLVKQAQSANRSARGASVSLDENQAKPAQEKKLQELARAETGGIAKDLTAMMQQSQQSGAGKDRGDKDGAGKDGRGKSGGGKNSGGKNGGSKMGAGTTGAGKAGMGKAGGGKSGGGKAGSRTAGSGQRGSGRGGKGTIGGANPGEDICRAPAGRRCRPENSSPTWSPQATSLWFTACIASGRDAQPTGGLGPRRRGVVQLLLTSSY